VNNANHGNYHGKSTTAHGNKSISSGGGGVDHVVPSTTAQQQNEKDKV